MDVLFRRTGERRYAVVVQVAGRPPQTMDPAPGFDDHIPHDLVHYVVEAELGLAAGVFGRAARGGGTFISVGSHERNARERTRQQRKQRRRESSLRSADDATQQHMATSERLAGLCDLAWRRRHGQRPDPSRGMPSEPLSPDDAGRIERVVARLDELASLWKELPVGGELVFTWPSPVPTVLGAPAEELGMDVNLGPLRQVALACSDLRRAIEFYRDTLGLAFIAEFPPAGLAFFRMGSTRLLLERHEGAVQSGAVLYFEVADVRAVQSALEARGVRFDSEPHLIHRDEEGTFGSAGAEEWMTFFKDPDGNLLSLAEHRAPA